MSRKDWCYGLRKQDKVRVNECEAQGDDEEVRGEEEWVEEDTLGEEGGEGEDQVSHFRELEEDGGRKRIELDIEVRGRKTERTADQAGEGTRTVSLTEEDRGK